MVPPEPCQVVSIGAQAGRGIEIVPGGDDQGLAALHRDAYQGVGCLPSLQRVILGHADDALPATIEYRVRIPQFTGRSEGNGLPPRAGGPGLVVQTPVREVRKVDLAFGDEIRSASIFVHARACIGGLGRYVGCPPIGGSPDDDAPSGFRRTALYPVDVVAVQLYLAEPDGSRDDQ